MGIMGRVAELGRDQLLELLGEDVLEHLRLVVDAVPRYPEVLDEVELEQAVVAHHLERDAAAGVRERHAVVRAALHESELAEALHHSGRRRGGDAEALGERVGAHRAAALLEGVDRLRVVLYRARDMSVCSEVGHDDQFELWHA
jgi:hypothetical protein